MFDPPEHKHTLWGALVGGPGSEDEHVDATNDFVYNEVAIDYNAGLVGALAGHYTYFGLAVRYYFDISELLPYNQTISAISFETYYDENSIQGDPVTAEGPIAYNDSDRIFYMELTWPKSGFYGKREYQFGLIAAQDANYESHWDPSNDRSCQGLGDVYVEADNVELFVEGVKYSGEAP